MKYCLLTMTYLLCIKVFFNNIVWERGLNIQLTMIETYLDSTSLFVLMILEQVVCRIVVCIRDCPKWIKSPVLWINRAEALFLNSNNRLFWLQFWLYWRLQFQVFSLTPYQLRTFVFILHLSANFRFTPYNEFSKLKILPPVWNFTCISYYLSIRRDFSPFLCLFSFLPDWKVNRIFNHRCADRLPSLLVPIENFSSNW